ncbi:MAG TPA: PEP-CTERM sorting domain-containing protein [Falsiroseomonas sp.]|jgi:hypothetical protein|nr:PEP-CTERM sorting domain-containing protein [Falsiroseomonas sp.]
MNMTRLLASTALALSLATGANAASIIGSFPGAGIGVTADTNPIAIGTTFSFASGATTSNGTGDLSGLLAGTVFTISSFTATAGGTFSYDIPNWGSFISVGNLVVGQSGPDNNRTVSVFAAGTFTPGANLASFDPDDASVTFSATQTGDAVVISASFTFASPPAPPPGIPEPMSLALFGLGLAGLGVAMRRKA